MAGVEHTAMSRLISRQSGDFDDFLVDYEPDPTEEGGRDAPTARRTVWLRPGAGGPDEWHLRLEDGCLFENGAPKEGRVVPIRLIENEPDRGCCGRAHEAPLMAQRYGPAFLMGNAIPLALEELAQPAGAPGLPMGGRRTITSPTAGRAPRALRPACNRRLNGS